MPCMPRFRHGQPRIAPPTLGDTYDRDDISLRQRITVAEGPEPLLPDYDGIAAAQ